MFRLSSRLGVPFKPLEELLLGLSVLALLFCSNVLQNQQSNQHLQQRTMIYSLLVVLTLGIHLRIEGKRWQLYPLYMCLLLLSLIPFFISTPSSSTSTTTDNTNINTATTTLLHWAIGMFLLSLLLNILVPLLYFPSTTGSFSVGSKDIHWKPQGHQHSHYAKIFYPISLSQNNSSSPSSSWNGFRRNVLFGNHARQSLRYFVDSMGNGMEQKFLSAMTGHLVSTETNSWHNAPLIDIKEIPKLPVIIFSPGLYGTPEIYSFLCEELASHGFFVLSIRHTDGSCNVMNFEAELVHRFRPLGKGVPKDEEWRFRNSQLSTRVKDVEYALSYLKEVWGLQNRLDLERISVVGHSFGGGTAAMAIREIKDVVRGISLDGWLFPLKNVDAGTEAEGEHALRDKHFLFSNSDLWQWKENLDRMRNLCSASTSPPSSPDSNSWQMITIKGTTHHSFDDVPLWFSNFLSQKVLKLAGPNLDQRSALEIIGQTSALYLKKDILDSHTSSSASTSSSSSSFIEYLQQDRTQKVDVPLVIGMKKEPTEEVESLWIKHLKPK